MSNIILSYPNRATAATITGGSWLAGLPVTNLANREMWKVARSTDDALASTQFSADLGALKSVRCVALANHNLSANATVLVKVKGESGNSNLLTYSEQFDNAAWTKTNTTILPNVATAPDGSVTADAWIESTGASQKYLRTPLASTGPATYTMSCYAKTLSGTRYLVLEFDAGGAEVRRSFFDLAGGTVSSNYSGAVGAITSVGGGWYRCAVTVTMVGAASATYWYISNSGASVAGYTGDGTSGLYIWGAQLEVGSTASTYKPTTTAASNIALHYSSGWQSAWRMVFDTLVEWESATWWAGTAGDEYLRSPYAVTAIADDTYSARYITVEINDTANADGYVQIGRLFVGGALQPTYNPQYGLQDGLKDLSTVDAAESGAMWGNEKRRIRYTSFVLAYATHEDAAYLHEMQRSLGTIGEVLYIPYPADLGESQRWGYIGRMSELSPIDYPYSRVRSVPLKLEEIA